MTDTLTTAAIALIASSITGLLCHAAGYAEGLRRAEHWIRHQHRGDDQ